MRKVREVLRLYYAAGMGKCIRRAEAQGLGWPLSDSLDDAGLWKKVRVNIDSHAEVAGHYSSVPHTLARRPLDVRLTAHTVECLCRGRSPLKGHHTTADEHMPEKHRRMGQWTPERFIRWTEKVGPPRSGACAVENIAAAQHLYVA